MNLSKNVNVIAVVPARGGSKGVPKKNIKLLNGKPLIAYTIEQALNTKGIDRVIVSTDCKDIAKISQAYGANVIIRPDDISGDFSSSEEALIHAVNHLKLDGIKPSIVVFLQCTSPIRADNDIEDTLELVLSGAFSSSLSAVANHKFLWRKAEDGSCYPVNYEPSNRKMRQSISEYQENGSIYVMKTKDLLNSKCRLNGNVGIHLMDEKSGYEIDTMVDFKVIETLMRD